jgi:hypothetical protein
MTGASAGGPTAGAAATPTSHELRELAARAWRRIAWAWQAIPLPEPWRGLALVLGVHWVALALFTLSVHHNGWLFYQGGDQIWYWTAGWLLPDGAITEPLITQGWALVMAPATLVAGPGFVSGLPYTVLLQVLVLAPIALWAVYEIAARIGGRPIGYLAALIWTLGPYVAIPAFDQRYHEKYVEQFLPHPLGLTLMPDYVSTVLLIVTAAFALGAILERDPRAAILAGLVAGFAATIKPSNLLILPPLAAVLLLWGRWRELVAFAVAVAPGVGAFSLWKYQGYGYLPAFLEAAPTTHLAAGDDLFSEAYAKYIGIDWSHLHDNILGVRETFFSLRVLEFLPVAGAIAVARRSLPAAVLVVFWFALFFIMRGAHEVSSTDSGSFWRFQLPTIPALVVLTAALPTLIPRVGTFLAERYPRPRAPRIRWRTLAVAAAFLALVPLVSAAVVTPLTEPDRTVQLDDIAIPVVNDLEARAQVVGDEVRLDWEGWSSSAAAVFYRVVRAEGATDVFCLAHANGADECGLTGSVVHATRGTVAHDRPGSGTWTYRIGVAANYRDELDVGDVFVTGPPVTVKVP